MANSYVMANGVVFHPKVPFTVTRIMIGTEKRMASAQLRRAVNATKYRYGPYESEEMTLAQLQAAEAAIGYDSSFTYRDEKGNVVTAVLVADSWQADLVRSVPNVQGAETGTGDTFYIVTFSLEDV